MSSKMPEDERQHAHEPLPGGEERCPSVNVTGKRCQGLSGHGGMHQAVEGAVRYIWSDETSPASAIDLIG